MEYNCECEYSKIVKKDGIYICSECFVLLDELEFENNLFSFESKTDARLRKFERHLNGIDLPWFIKFTFLDIFKTIENYFYDSARINFINMHQLCIEL